MSSDFHSWVMFLIKYQKKKVSLVEGDTKSVWGSDSKQSQTDALALNCQQDNKRFSKERLNIWTGLIILVMRFHQKAFWKYSFVQLLCQWPYLQEQCE